MPNGKKSAICIGINYVGSPYQLGGCEYDARCMARWLGGQGYETKLMTASSAASTGNQSLQPNLKNIVAAIMAVSRDPSITQFTFYYAGHGTQVRDTSGDEEDGKDEALVCQSARGPMVVPRPDEYFVDDDFVALLRAQFASRDIDIFIVIDACHSGTMCDFGHQLRGARAWGGVRGLVAGPGDKYRVLCLSAASDHQCALETSDGGVMTQHLCGLLNGGRTTISDLAKAFSEFTCQTPVISAIAPYSLDASRLGSSLVSGGTRAFGTSSSASSAPVSTRNARIQLQLQYARAALNANLNRRHQ